MYISNATGCSSIWGGAAPSTPYTVNKESGHGPAWCNSLFEDNAEHGLGLYLGQKVIRERLIGYVRELNDMVEKPEFKAVIENYLNTLEDGKANEPAAKALIAALEGCACDKCADLRGKILAEKEYLSKKSVWIFGGDGWAYDIGFGGLDHVLASGEDVNVFVFDTEVYSNTGGQASKASNMGQVAQFAAAGKAIGKKSLAEIAMSYGYVYVAQVAMGADMNQTHEGSDRGGSLPRSFAHHRLRALRDARHQGRYAELPAGDEACGGCRLLADVPLQSDSGERQADCGFQGAHDRLHQVH